MEVDFRYILKSNYEVEISGTAIIDCNNEYELIFEKTDGTYTDKLFVNHYGVEVTPNDLQNEEIDKLKNIFLQDITFISLLCEYADTNKVIELDDVFVVVNGADFETLIRGV